MKNVKSISLVLAFMIIVSFNVPVFAEQMGVTSLDVQIIDKGEYIEIVEDGSISRIYDNIMDNTRYIEIKNEKGELLNSISVDLRTSEISRNGIPLNIKANLDLYNNDIFPHYLDGDGSEENPYKFCTPGATTDYNYHRYTLREMADVVGDVATATSIMAAIIAISGLPTQSLAALSAAISGLALIAKRSEHKFYDRIGIRFNSKKVCILQTEFDAGEYVYFYQKSTVCYNASTFQ